jgi:hypothetical protein
MLNFYLFLQIASTTNQNVHYAIGLSLVCFIVLMLLWLPDFFKEEE